MTDYARLPTEQSNPASRSLDRLSPFQIVSLMNREDRRVVAAVSRARRPIARAVETITAALRKKGRLFFVGAGTSGRLCVLEAAECPPTFNTSTDQIQAMMAGGASSVFRSKEGAEDRGEESRRLVARRVKSRDVLVGVAASGVTPFVRAALAESRRKKVKTVLVTCNGRGDAASLADVVIVLDTGPEVLTGSTRLKAGTATKMVLNMLTTASMARLGKVYGNWMVDLQPRSQKLVARGLRLIQRLGGVTEEEALRCFEAAGGGVKIAIAMARRKFSKRQARRALEKAGGSLRKILG